MWMTWIQGTGWAALLGWLAIGGPAHSAGAVPEPEISAAQYVDQSDMIFVGRLMAKENFFSGDRRLILTRYFFSIVEPIKGKLRDRESLVEYGGEVDGLRLTVSHGVTYEKGREYLIFAETARDGTLRTLGGPLGRLPVLSDGAGERHVRLNSGHPLRESLGGPGAVVRPVRQLREAIEALSRRPGQ